jgi:hypothetical protein
MTSILGPGWIGRLPRAAKCVSGQHQTTATAGLSGYLDAKNSKNSPRAGRDSLGVITTAPPKEIHMINRIRTLVVTAAGAAVLASGLGLAAVGAAGTANADVCVEYYGDGTAFYYYC